MFFVLSPFLDTQQSPPLERNCPYLSKNFGGNMHHVTHYFHTYLLYHISSSSPPYEKYFIPCSFFLFLDSILSKLERRGWVLGSCWYAACLLSPRLHTLFLVSQPSVYRSCFKSYVNVIIRCGADPGPRQAPNAASKQRQEASGGTSLLSTAALPRTCLPGRHHHHLQHRVSQAAAPTFTCTGGSERNHLEAQSSIPMGDFG